MNSSSKKHKHYGKTKTKSGKNMLKRIIAVSSLLFAASSVNAGLINPTGNADGLNFSWSQQESDQLQTFDEQQGVAIAHQQVQVDYLLGSNLFVGDTLRGQQTGKNSPYLSAGSYSSHLIHFDPLGTSSGKETKQLIEFDSDIVAIILNGKKLNASDNIFGGTGANYETSTSRKWESNDFLTFTSSQSILVDRATVGRYWIDDARIITQSVSEPSSIALLGLGLLGLVGIRRKKI
ncbi:hypothetical protein A3752_05710 [Oleiphilus sp. HI0081]|nr:PEP-CTERM sorting domain-containing protein [Oleiphilus sp. HI0132]KZY59085.1 hypothetical protein A3735_16180 [Oleiphilus sp. HI0061]KZY78494.1 hypothetical protein A3741_08490 [Oleiphilus sp. HI0069]KZZ10161.1 hypothetical protein A3749_01495 [Oleiphilus sp. HI0078]KZZ23209.1 hypothetical protein A3752_05710 [Oleiphilus sp. HI0081]KZZ44436.1 hypothetical protein A3755_03280 [Oleiphilus sp. HI0085]KZZ63502.1 hypothetical protein A3763_06595 [Oleiphilus sp. HI0128]